MKKDILVDGFIVKVNPSIELLALLEPPYSDLQLVDDIKEKKKSANTH
jgi:hypothetical protein